MVESDPPLTPNLESKKGKVQESRVYHHIFDKLHERIQGGDRLASERIPSTTQLAQAFRVGARSIREEIRSAHSIGLVKIKPGSGVYVAGTRPTTELSSQLQKVVD